MKIFIDSSRRVAVEIAERCGWLSLVDARIVKEFLGQRKSGARNYFEPLPSLWTVSRRRKTTALNRILGSTERSEPDRLSSSVLSDSYKLFGVGLTETQRQQLIRSSIRAGSMSARRGVSSLDTEQKIIKPYKDAASSVANAASSKVMKSIDGAKRPDAVAIADGLQALEAKHSANIDAIKMASLARLADKYSNVADAQASLMGFTEHARIDYPADYPVSRFRHYGSLFAVGISLCVVNAWFFGAGAVYGLVGGFFNVTIVSMVLVCSSVMAGILARSSFSPNRIHKVFGLIGMGAFVALSVFISLILATLLDAMTNNFIDAPWTLPVLEILIGSTNLSFRAIALLAFALTVTSFAVFKGFTSDARVPGYGALTRAVDHARDDYDVKLHTATQDVHKLQETAAKEVEELRARSIKSISQRAQFLARARAVLSAYERTEAALAEECANAIRAYRSAVETIAARQEKWPPLANPDFLELQLENLENLESIEQQIREDWSRLDEQDNIFDQVSVMLGGLATEAIHDLYAYSSLQSATRLGERESEAPRHSGTTRV